MDGVHWRMPLGCLADDHHPVIPSVGIRGQQGQYPGPESPAPQALGSGVKAVDSPTSSGANCPSTPPRPSPLRHPRLLPAA